MVVLMLGCIQNLVGTAPISTVTADTGVQVEDQDDSAAEVVDSGGADDSGDPLPLYSGRDTASSDTG